MSQKPRKQKPRKGNSSKQRRGNKRDPGTVIMRGPMFMPARIRTTLRYSKQLNMASSTGWANIRFEPTYAYDVDPVGASTAMPGFTELAGIYRLYRVVSSRIRVIFSNLDTLAGEAVICPVNFDPGANTSSYQNYLSSRSARTTALGAVSGNGGAILNHSFTVAQFSGAPIIGAVDYYVGSGSTAPGNNVWWLVGAYMSNTMTSGVFVGVNIDITLDFFELNSPTT